MYGPSSVESETQFCSLSQEWIHLKKKKKKKALKIKAKTCTHTNKQKNPMDPSLQAGLC